MYKRWMDMVSVATVVFLIPLLILLFLSASHNGKTDAPHTSANRDTQTILTAETEESVLTISILTENDQMVEVPLNTYVVGVVLAEMPADFDINALKAQAVVARTYALKRAGRNNKHPAAVCTNASCCQGYVSPDAYVRNNGTLDNLRKVESAVEETMNLVLVYNGDLIEATYFSCSGGRTEDAVAVWGESIPYLKSTKSPGEENATHYTDTVRFSIEEFQRKLDLNTKGDPHTWIGNVTYTDGGGVDTMTIAGTVYKGTELRSLLGLRSTAFSMTIIGTTVVVTTKGFGHRVGMSQYGAEAMAVRGSSFDQILQHYYSGTELMMYNG